MEVVQEINVKRLSMMMLSLIMFASVRAADSRVVDDIDGPIGANRVADGRDAQTILTIEATEWRHEMPHGAQPSSAVAMSRNRRLLDTWYEQMWNRWDKTMIPKICAEEITFRGSLGEVVHGHAGVAAYMDRIRQGFPDFTNVIEDVISERDKAFARLTYVGTHQGTVLGFPPTGKKVTYSGAAVFTFQGDKIVDVWVLGDLQTLTRQLQ